MNYSNGRSALRLAAKTAFCAVLVGTTALAAGVAVSPIAGATTTAPPWEATGTNYGSVGGLFLFNSSGDAVTSGTLTSAPIAAYVEGTSTIRAGDTKASLFAYTPVDGVAPGTWSGEQLSSSTAFPDTSAPSPLNTSTLPVVTGGSSDEDLTQYISDFPNNDTSGDGYAGLYQLRLKTTASGLPGNTTYDSADILVSGSTWSLVYPTQVTTTVLTTTPASPVVSGASTELTATIAPSGATGTVQFRNGTVAIGSPVTVSDGTATTTTSSLPVGSDELYAVYTPDATSGGDGDSASSGNTLLDVQTATTTTLTTEPATDAGFGTSVQLNAAVTPSGATGTVQFENGSTPIGSPVTVSGGTASTTTSLLPAGDLTLNAVFTGTGTYADSSGSTSFTVNPESTTTTLTTDPATDADYGVSVQFTATVTPSGATGTVQFENGSTPIGSPVTVSDGTASTTTSTLPAGGLTLNAEFTGTGNYASSSGSTPFTVNGATTTTVLTTDPADSATSGMSVELIATVTPSEATGTVQFENGSTDIGTPVTVTDGTASTSTSTLPVGGLTLNAVFTGTGDYAGSTGSTPFTVNGISTSTALATVPATSTTYGTSVQLNATVTSSEATGTVQFENGSTDIGSPVTVSDGSASTTTSTLPVGDLTLNAVFVPTGGNGYAGSTGSASLTVSPATTGTTVTTDPATDADFGTSVLITATVTPSDATGTVQFEDGSTDIGSPVTLSDGTASTTTSTLPVGALTLNAVLTGTGNYGGSSVSASFTVNPISTDTSLSANPSTPQFSGTSVRLTATVTPSEATGTVQFENGSTPIGSPVTLSDGSASTTTSTLPVGDLTLNAVYSPANGDYVTSSGTTPFVVEELTSTSTTLSTAPADTAFSGVAVQLAASVTPSEATGTVQFENGSTDIGSPVAVSDGSATLTTSTLPVGDLTLNAVFVPTGGTGYAGSSGTAALVVEPLIPTVTTVVASPASPQNVGTSVQFTATIAPAVPGTVQFECGSTDIGSPVTVNDGTASITTSTLPAGDLTVTAVFTATTGLGYASSSGDIPFTIAGISGKGYQLATTDGGVFSFGDAGPYGSAAGTTLSAPIVGIAATPDGKGYWLVGADGGVFAFGDAHFYGSTGGVTLNAPIVGIAAMPAGKGYWLVGADGGVFAFGDAHFYGSTGGVTLNAPIVGIAAMPDGKGYWLVGADGGVFAFGDAHFYGSTGGVTLNAPIVGIAAMPDGKGYWLVGADGGIFSFGDARFYGSTGGVTLNAPIVGIAAMPDGKGYWLVGADGGIFSFGDARFYGSIAGTALDAPVVGLTGA